MSSGEISHFTVPNEVSSGDSSSTNLCIPSSLLLRIVMPDNKTTYSADDGSNTAFWKFVADTPKDMSSGTLYGAKLNQTNDQYGGDFQVN